MQASTAITWFEIPARDLERASRFYETVLQTTLRRESMDGSELAVFPYQTPGVGGCLVKGSTLAPAAEGSIVYLHTAEIDQALLRVEGAGGRVALGKTALPPGMGSYAHVIDSEGNRVGLHGMS